MSHFAPKLFFRSQDIHDVFFGSHLCLPFLMIRVWLNYESTREKYHRTKKMFKDKLGHMCKTWGHLYTLSLNSYTNFLIKIKIRMILYKRNEIKILPLPY